MGTYTTLTSVDTLVPNYELNTTTASTPTGQVIDWAESIVNGKIGRKYDISSSPFTAYATTPPIVRSLTEQLTIGYIYKTWSRGSKESLTRGEAMIKMAMEQLEMIMECEMDILDTSGSIIVGRSTHEEILSNTDDYSTTFDEDDPLLWEIDSDKLDDIASGRT